MKGDLRMKHDSSLKILEWDQIEGVVHICREGRLIVLVTGVWDLMHDGHVTYLENAAKWGDLLFVGVDSNARVQRGQKGSKRPILDQAVRLRTIVGLACVDFAFLFDDLEDLVAIVRPDVIVVSPTTKEDPEYRRFDFVRVMEMNIPLQPVQSASSVHTSGIIADIVAKYGNGA